MRVLGVDPGLSRCGYGALDGTVHHSAVVAAGVLRTSPAAGLAHRLAELQAEVRDLVVEIAPDVVAVERVFFQANVRTAMAVGQASGIVLAEAATAGCEVVLYTPNEVKQAVTGSGSADKLQVQRMVQTQLGLARLPEPPDTADALALALCHLAVGGLQARVAAGGGARA